MVKAASKDTRKQIAAHLISARDGKTKNLTWLHHAVLAAGYVDAVHLGRKELAGICQVSVTTIGKWIAAGLPTHGRWMSLQEVCAWLAERLRERRLAPAGAGGPLDDDDPILYSGVSSPELEKLRKIKRQMAELDLAQRRGQLQDVADLTDKFRHASDVLRSELEAVGRRHGPGVATEIQRAIAACNEQLGIELEDSSQ